MADSVNIDWGQLRQPDPLGDYQSAFQAGRAIAAQRAGAGNTSGPAGNTPPPPDPRPPVDTTPVQPRFEPPAAGIHADIAGPAAIQDRIATLTDAQRQAASQAQEQFAAILNGLKMQTGDLDERLAIARHLAGLHPEFGIHPNAITADDVSDPGIAGHIAAAMSLKSQIDDANTRLWGSREAQPINAIPERRLRQDDPGQTLERATFFQRAAMLGLPGRAIDPLWAQYAATHHGGGVLGAAPQSGAPEGLSASRALSDGDLIAALGLHGVTEFAPRDRVSPPPPSRPHHPHTLSDQDLKSALEL